MSLRERLLEELEAVYARVDKELAGGPGNRCGTCFACCTSDGLTHHRVGDLEMELIAARLGESRAHEFRRYLQREKVDGQYVHQICPNYKDGCSIYPIRPFSCRAFGHYRMEATGMPPGCVYIGQEKIVFAKSEYYSRIPESRRLRVITREFQATQPSSHGYVTPEEGALPADMDLSILDFGDPADRALASMARQDLEKALEELLEARQEHPQSAHVEYTLGMVLGMLDQHEAALTAFCRARQIIPERADVHYYVGYHNLMLGRGQEGLASLLEAVRLEPRHALALGFIGYHYVTAGRLGEARDYFQRAHQADPGNPYFERRLAQLS